VGKGTILFVHGSGNRSADANAYAATLRSHLGVDETKLKASTWGDNTGPDPTFPRMDDILPPTPQGFGEEIDPAAEDAMRPLDDLKPTQGGVVLEAATPRPDTERAMALLRSGVVDLAEIGVSTASVQQAAAEVQSSPEYLAATGPDAIIMDAAIRSTVARALELEPGLEGFGLPSEISDFINRGAAKVGQTLLAGAGSILGDVAGSGLGDAAKLELSKRIAPQRAALMRKSILVAADVLAYQRRGAAMRAWVAKEISECEPPVVVLGHSLGGIILVDTLFGPDAATDPIKQQLSGVKQVVTFGSQSALLAALNAIDDIKPTVPWLNIWTTYDFVSFLDEKIWPGLVDDRQIMINVGFPDSHGKYYDIEQFYDVIKESPVVQGILAP
jgi:hypothetical protein